MPILAGDLTHVHYPNVERIRVVVGNLSTHSTSALLASATHERCLETAPQVHGQERVRSNTFTFTIGDIEMEPPRKLLGSQMFPT
jgi:hypothetical protein